MVDSLTNMDAVKPKGPKVFVAAALLALAAGGAWFALGRDPGPAGAAEDPARVLVIADDDPGASQLAQMGFSVEQRSMGDAASAGRSSMETTDDIAAVLHHADVEGFGYVAFADAASIDFGSRAVSPDSATIGTHHYAVFSVGDLAQPAPKVTVDPNPQHYDLPGHVELLRALFEQDKLAATLVGESNLSIEAQPLFDRIEAAVELKGAYGMVDQKARGADKRLHDYLLDSEEADPKPKPLSEGLERTHGYALANGSALLLVDAPVLTDPDTDKVALTWTGDTRAWTVDPGTAERTRCEVADRIRPGAVRVHAHGATLLARWGSNTLMVLGVDPKAPGCALRQLGTIADNASNWGNANVEGKVVRTSVNDGSVVAEIHTPDEAHPQTWPLAGCTAATTPVWIGENHIATTCEYLPPPPAEPLDGSLLDEGEDAAPPPVPEQRWIYLMSVEDGSVLALPMSEEHRFTPSLRHRPTPSGLSVLVRNMRGFSVYDFSQDVGALFAAPPVDPDAARPAFVDDPAAGVRALPASAATERTVPLDASLRRFVVSPDGTRAAFQVDQSGQFESNLALYSFTSGKTRRFAINEWAGHDDPSFTPDGSVVFNSTYSPLGRGQATVAQVTTPPSP